jgi:hypothetical protein
VNSPLANPFGRGHPHRIGRIQQYHAVGGANGTTMVVMFDDCCVGCQVFVPAGTLIGVKLLMNLFIVINDHLLILLLNY